MLEVPFCVRGLVGHGGGVGGGLGVLEVGEHIESIEHPCWRRCCICREGRSGWAREVYALRACLCEGGLSGGVSPSEELDSEDEPRPSLR